MLQATDFNSSASITVQHADDHFPLAELNFSTAVRQLHLYEVLASGDKVLLGLDGQLDRRAGGYLGALRAKLVDEDDEVVDESNLAVVLRYDTDQTVSCVFRSVWDLR